ncbi:MAG: CPBP family intramembrane metalloprotease [Firmicutes bacterium]|nr:CPBP family intramembrane metalloprotease [Bacillota bacterium]
MHKLEVIDMFSAFLAILIIYFTVTAILDARILKLLTAVPITEKARLTFYIRTIVFGWASTIVVMAMLLVAHINLAAVGLRWFAFDYNIWFTVLTLVLCGILFILASYQIIGYLVNPRYRATLNEAIKGRFAGDKEKSQYGVITNFLIPRRKREKLVFFWVALTAGIGEEFLLRGFLFLLLQAVFPNISIILVVIVSGVFFGLWHLYQGVHGMIKTAITGALLGCLYIATGSLILPMLLHFITDFSAAFALSEE